MLVKLGPTNHVWMPFSDRARSAYFTISRRNEWLDESELHRPRVMASWQ